MNVRSFKSDKSLLCLLVAAVTLSTFAHIAIAAGDLPACANVDKAEIDAERAQFVREHGGTMQATHGALAVNVDNGNCASAHGGYSEAVAGQRALDVCRIISKGNCTVWAIDGVLTDEARVVLQGRQPALPKQEEVQFLDSQNCTKTYEEEYSRVKLHKALVEGRGILGKADPNNSRIFTQCVMVQGYTSTTEAQSAALNACETQHKAGCHLFAADDIQLVQQNQESSSSDDTSTQQAISDALNQASATINQGVANRNAIRQAAADQQRATLAEQQQLQQQRQMAAQQATQNQQRQTYQQQQSTAQAQASAQPARSAVAAPTTASRLPASTQSAPQPSYTYADAVVPDNGSPDQYGQVPNIYAVNVTNTGQVRLYCTADAKAQTYNQTIKCPDPSNCQGVTSWYTNSGSTYVLPGSTGRVVGIRYYAGQGSYTVNCRASQ
jgi:hypothetical protein